MILLYIVEDLPESIDEWRRDNLVQLRARMQSNSLSSILETIKHSHYLSLISHSAIQHRQDIVSKSYLMDLDLDTYLWFIVMICI